MFKFIASAILATLALALSEPTPSASLGIPGEYPASPSSSAFSGVSEEYAASFASSSSSSSASSFSSGVSEEYTSSPSPSPAMEDGASSCCGSVESEFSSDSSDFILFGEEVIDFGDARRSGYPDSGYDTFSLESGSFEGSDFFGTPFSDRSVVSAVPSVVSAVPSVASGSPALSVAFTVSFSPFWTGPSSFEGNIIVATVRVAAPALPADDDISLMDEDQFPSSLGKRKRDEDDEDDERIIKRIKTDHVYD
ncbi:hypothetical protein BDB01DRAFT_852694 [Pilobolus umbonatus]|nr:hypothetical protein BDB01DRAFT_852694 [Pilobolus umbonatus]